MLRWLRGLFYIGKAARTPLLELDAESLEMMRQRLLPLKDLSHHDWYASLDEETRARLRSRQASAGAADIQEQEQ